MSGVANFRTSSGGFNVTSCDLLLLYGTPSSFVPETSTRIVPSRGGVANPNFAVNDVESSIPIVPMRRSSPESLGTSPSRLMFESAPHRFDSPSFSIVIFAVITSVWRYSEPSVEIVIVISGFLISATHEMIFASGDHGHLPTDSRSSLSVASLHSSLISSLSQISPVVRIIFSTTTPVSVSASSELCVISSATAPSPLKSVALTTYSPTENCESSPPVIVWVCLSFHETSPHEAMDAVASMTMQKMVSRCTRKFGSLISRVKMFQNFVKSIIYIITPHLF